MFLTVPHGLVLASPVQVSGNELVAPFQTDVDSLVALEDQPVILDVSPTVLSGEKGGFCVRASKRHLIDATKNMAPAIDTHLYQTVAQALADPDLARPSAQVVTGTLHLVTGRQQLSHEIVLKHEIRPPDDLPPIFGPDFKLVFSYYNPQALT